MTPEELGDRLEESGLPCSHSRGLTRAPSLPCRQGRAGVEVSPPTGRPEPTPCASGE